MRIRALTEKIKKKAAELLKVISTAFRSVGMLRELLQKEESKEALHFVLKRLKELLKAFRPDKGGKIYAALDDPYSEGCLTSVMAFLFPLYGERIEFQPEFSADKTTVTVSLSGRVRLFTVLLAAARLYFNRKVRQLYGELKSILKIGDTDGESE